MSAKTRLDVHEAAELWGITPNGVEKFMQSPGAPKRGKDGRWPRVAALEYRQTRIRARRGTRKPTPGTLEGARLRKVDLECERLQIEIDKARGQLIPAVEVAEQLSGYAHIVNTTLGSWEAEAAHLSGDSVLAAEAGRLTRRTRQALADGIRAACGA